MVLTMIAVDWSIRGYHAFHVRPHPEISMFLELEPQNRYDSNAIKVKMPEIEYIPENLRNQSTRDGQTVRQIAGKIVGRVPRNLCTVFTKLIEDGLCEIGAFRVNYMGRIDFTQSGPELLCSYVLSVES